MPVPEETINLVEDIFMQGDARYIDPEGAVILAQFIHYKAIVFEKIYIYDIETTDEEEKGIPKPQENYKALAKRLLEKEGCKIVGYERLFPGGRSDVLAKDKFENNIVVECCSCRINKAINYLEEDNTVLWILSHSDEDKMPVTRLPLYIIKRGSKWDAFIEKYHNYLYEELMKVPNLLDDLEDG